jgi:hypothetical protein
LHVSSVLFCVRTYICRPPSSKPLNLSSRNAKRPFKPKSPPTPSPGSVVRRRH